MNSVPGLETVRSITSRGSAEINLFFNWNVNMFQTLEYVNAALARVQPTLPVTAKLTANRLTFAAFPILGYSLTSATMTQADLWELANYTIKPRLNRVNGVSMVVVQGGQTPEFQIEPDPAKMLEAQITVPNILDAVARGNLIDSPGLIENNHELSIALVSSQARTPAEIANIVVKTTQSNVPIRIGDLGPVMPSVAPVYTIVTANGKPAVLLNIFRQPTGNTVAVADMIAKELDSIRTTLPAGVKIQAFYDQSELVRDSISSVRRYPHRAGPRRHNPRIVPSRLGQFHRRGTGHPRHHRNYFYCPADSGRQLRSDDSGRLGRRGRSGDRRCDRRCRKHRDAPRFGPVARRSHPQRADRNPHSADRLDGNADRRFPAADFDYRRHGHVFPRACSDRGHRASDLARAGADVDAHAQPLPAAPSAIRQGPRSGFDRRHDGTPDAGLRRSSQVRAGPADCNRARLHRVDRRVFPLLPNSRQRSSSGNR